LRRKKGMPVEQHGRYEEGGSKKLGEHKRGRDVLYKESRRCQGPKGRGK